MANRDRAWRIERVCSPRDIVRLALGARQLIAPLDRLKMPTADWRRRGRSRSRRRRHEAPVPRAERRRSAAPRRALHRPCVWRRRRRGHRWLVGAVVQDGRACGESFARGAWHRRRRWRRNRRGRGRRRQHRNQGFDVEGNLISLPFSVASFVMHPESCRYENMTTVFPFLFHTLLKSTATGVLIPVRRNRHHRRRSLALRRSARSCCCTTP